MKCPLQNRLVSFTPGKYSYEIGDCRPEDCAWWDTENEQCALCTLASAGWLLNKELLELTEKMPKEFQFRDRMEERMITGDYNEL